MSFVARKTAQKKPSLGIHHSDASLETDSNGCSAKIPSAPGGRGTMSELHSGSSAGQRSPMAPRPDVADVLPVACATFALPSAVPGAPRDTEVRSATTPLIARAPFPPPGTHPGAAIAAAEARAQGYIEPPQPGGAARRPAWPLPTRRSAARPGQRGRMLRARDAAGRGAGPGGWIGDVVSQPTDTEGDDTIMSQDDNYLPWEGALVDPVGEIPEEPEGASAGLSGLTTSRSMPLLNPPSGITGEPSAPMDSEQLPPNPTAVSTLSIPDPSDVSSHGPRYHVDDRLMSHAPPVGPQVVPTNPATQGPPVSRAAPATTNPRPVRDGWGACALPRTGLASFPLPPISPPPNSFTPPPNGPLNTAPHFRQPSGSENSVPSSSLLFTPRLQATEDRDADTPSKQLPAAQVSTPSPSQIMAQLPVAAMATGDSDTTPEARDGPTASAGASSDDSDMPAAPLRAPRLVLGGLVTAAIGSDSSGCSLRMMSSPNPTDPAETGGDHPPPPDAPSGSSYPAIHPSGCPTTDLSIPQPSTLMSFDSDADGNTVPQATLDKCAAMAQRAAQDAGAPPSVWTNIAPGNACNVHLSDATESFLQDTIPDSVLDTLPDNHHKASGASLIEETAAMPVAAAVAAWPPAPAGTTLPLRPHSAQPALVHAHSFPREHVHSNAHTAAPSGMHSPFQPARSFPNLQRMGSGVSNPGVWVPEPRSIEEIISTTTYQPTPSAMEAAARHHSSPVNMLTGSRTGSRAGSRASSRASSPMHAALQLAPGMRLPPPAGGAPPRPVSPKGNTAPHMRRGMYLATVDAAELAAAGPYSSPGVSGALSGTLAGAHHRSSPLPPIAPIQSGHASPVTHGRRRVSSPGGAGMVPLPPPPPWLSEPPTNAAYPRIVPQSAPVIQQQHFDCGDLPEELAPSTLLDTWPPVAPAPPSGQEEGASDADDERDSNGSESSDGRDSLDMALGESCVLPWGLPAALQPAAPPPHSVGPLRSPAEAAGKSWDSPPDSPQPPQSLPLPPIREESLGTEHLEYLYQSDYASTPAASVMQTLTEGAEMPASPRNGNAAAAETPQVVAAVTAATPAVPEAPENLDVSVSIAAAILPAGGSSSARGPEEERRLSGDIGRSALSASGSISDSDAGRAAAPRYASLYTETSNIVLQPRSAQPLTTAPAGPASQAPGLFLSRKFLDVSRVKNPPGTSGPLPSPGGSSGSTLFPNSVRSRPGGPTPRESHTLDPGSPIPLAAQTSTPYPLAQPSSATNVAFLQESTSAPTVVGLSHFSHPLSPRRSVTRASGPLNSRVSIDTASSAPLHSNRVTPRLDPPSSIGTTASGFAIFSGPLSSQPPLQPLPEPTERIIHMRHPAPPPCLQADADAAASSSDSGAVDEPLAAALSLPGSHGGSAAPLEALVTAAAAATGTLAPGGGASMTSVDTGNSTLMSRMESLPHPMPVRTLTLGSMALPTIDADPQEDTTEVEEARATEVATHESAELAAAAAAAAQPGGTRGNPCEPALPPMVIADSSASTVAAAAAVAASAAISAAVSAVSQSSSSPGPNGGPSAFSEHSVEHSHRTMRSEGTGVSGSSGVTASSWASVYPRYIFHYSLMQLSGRGGRDTPSTLASPANASMMSGAPMTSPGRSVPSRRSLVFADGPRAAAEEQQALASARGVRSLPRLPLRRRSAGRPGLPAQDSVVSISEVSDEEREAEEDDADEFVDAQSDFLTVSGGISSVSASRDASALRPDSREDHTLSRSASAIAPVNSAGTRSTGAVSSASNQCVADSAVVINARMAELSAPSTDGSPAASADAADASPAPHLLATLAHSLLALSSEGLPSRAASECSVMTPTAAARVAALSCDASSRDASPTRRSPTMSPSGRYLPPTAVGSNTWTHTRLDAMDIDTPRQGAPGHDGLEVFQRRCPEKSLVTGAWEQGHVSWYVNAWDIREAVIVTQPKTLPQRILAPREAPPRAPAGHVPSPPAHSATAQPLMPLARRLCTHPEESGGSTMPVQSSLEWGSSMHFESMMQMTSLRPDLDADALTHSVQLTAQEPLPPGWTLHTAGEACGRTAPMPRGMQETVSAEVDGAAANGWMYQSLPANVQSEIRPAIPEAGPEADTRARYGAMQPRSVGNQYTSVLRSSLLPRSLGWGSHQRRGEGKAGTGRPPRPRTGPPTSSGSSSTTSLLQRCKRALSRSSFRRSKHASADMHARSGLVHTMSSFSSAPEMSTMLPSPAARSGRIVPGASVPVDSESDADVQMLPPMDVTLEESEAAGDDAGGMAAVATPKGRRRGRRWLQWWRRR